jgi:2-polyprenyl-3-methyl-5-hydroxy-6-metoxy-1,4-benzoquinol methylase
MTEKEISVPPCRLCGAPMGKELLEEEHLGVLYHIAHCTHCDLVQAVEHVSSLSPDYVNLDKSAMDQDRVWCQGAHKLPAFRQWLSLSRKFSVKPVARLLDVGCGTGGFLRFASQHGFEIYGFDASQSQAEYAASEFPNVRCSASLAGYLRELNQSNLKFDIITLWDVFEHIRDPLSFIEEIKASLDSRAEVEVAVLSGDPQEVGFLSMGARFLLFPSVPRALPGEGWF